MKLLPLPTTLLLLSLLAAVPALASDPVPMAPTSRSIYYDASYAVTFQGSVEAANRFDHIDFHQFNVGNGQVVGGDYDGSASVTLKGLVYFDLESGNLRQALKNPGDEKIVLSFILMQVRGQPRPMRVEFIGTFQDASSKQAAAKQFQANPLVRVNNVLRQVDKPSVKMVDVTPIAKQSLDQRWLVFRFEQEGLRIENTGQDDFYQLNSEPDTVRLTLSGKGSAAREVSTHYTTNSGDGEYGYNLITDMPKNLLGDMPKNLLGDMPKNLITDTPDSQNNPPPADAHGAD